MKLRKRTRAERAFRLRNKLKGQKTWPPMRRIRGVHSRWWDLRDPRTRSHGRRWRKPHLKSKKQLERESL